MSAELVEQELESKAVTWPERAKSIAICDQRSYETAAGLLLDIAALEKEIKAHHEPIKTTAFAAHKAAVAAEKKLLDPLQEATGILKRGLGAWLQEQERIRQEAERKAREAAAKIEEEQRLALAVQAEQEGAAPETVEEIIETPLPIAQPVAARTYAPVAGVSARKVWKWEIIDPNLIPRQYLVPDTVAINRVVAGLKQNANIPGILVYEETGIAARSR